MIYLNEHIMNKISSLESDNLYVVADFDRTITAYNSYSSWGILGKSNFVCEEYTKENEQLYRYYYPIEFNFNIDPITKNRLMHEWWTKAISLFVKYGLKEEIVNNATSNISGMQFRTGGREFLRCLYERNIPVIIMSAGIGNFIEQFLIHNKSLFSNIHIISNFIKFENGVAVGIENDIIHSQNKNVISLNKKISDEIADKNDILLLGDNLADIKMAPEEKRNNTIRIGFLDYNINENINKFKEEFDVVCTDDTSFCELSKVLKKVL